MVVVFVLEGARQVGPEAVAQRMPWRTGLSWKGCLLRGMTKS